ncbi:MAG: hypothetical protein WBX23_11415 [Candidatus Cybelea sp.]
MKSVEACFYAFSINAAAALLVGCGGSQPPIGVPATMPQSRATITHAVRGRSWMLPEAKGENLIYADSPDSGNTYVFSYPNGKLVGTITGGTQIQGSLCSDAHGDVFVTGVNGSGLGLIYEYAHGSTTPKEVLQEEGVWPDGCSSDPTTDNLAVSAWNWVSGVSGVNVYQKARGTPTYYEDAAIIDYAYCGYDNSGNLFINGQGSGYDMYFAELPKGVGGFINLKFDKYVNYFDMGQIQWDGHQITLEDLSVRAIYRIVVAGFYARTVAVTHLRRWNAASIALSWIVGDHAVAATGPQDSEIDAWPYPRSGKPAKIATAPGSVFSVAYSAAKR